MAQTNDSRRATRAILLFCCLAAFTLGAHGLSARSLWGDEAFSVWASRQPLVDLVGGLDAQPPLYHLMLAAGRWLWGESVFAIRFASLLCGVALAALAGRLGRLIGGSGAGVLCAALIATSPMVIYFEQEARMYALGAALAGGAMLMSVVLLRGSATPKARWLAYVLLSLGALYTHYYTAGILFANTLALLARAIVEARRSRQTSPLLVWAAAHGAIALGFGTWFVLLQFRYLGRAAARKATWIPALNDIIANLGRGINGLVFGMRADTALTPLALALFALALLGIAGLWRRRRSRAFAPVTFLWILCGIALVALTAAPSGIVPDFNPRYMLFVLFPLAVAVSGWRLVIGEWRLTALPAYHSLIPGLRSLVVVMLVALPALYGNAILFDTSWAKSQYDRLGQTIRQRYDAGDGVALLNSDQFPLYDYYGPQQAGVWIMGNDLWDTARSSILDEQLDAFLQGKSRVWLVNYGWAAVLSPRPRVEQRLNALGARVYYQGFQDATLALYQLVDGTVDAPFEHTDVRFGEHIHLAGTRWRVRQFRPGEVITLDLLWRADQKLPVDYTVFVHLRRVDDSTQVAAFDSQPVNGAAPTTSWAPGAGITDTHAIAIPADARPGEYAVVIGLYQYPSFERLKLAGQDGTEYTVGSVQVGE